MSQITKQAQGFSLVELMVVLVIMGVLVAVTLPNFIGAQDRAKASSVKANMRTFHAMVEVYGMDHGFLYPQDVNTLVTAAGQAGYLKLYENPYRWETATTANLAVDLATPPAASAVFGPGGANNRGQVLYRNALRGEAFTLYAIYGLDKDGRYLRYLDQAFTLSNG